MTGYTEWELWWARVVFEDEDEYKIRPVLVKEAHEVYAITYKVTSQEPRNDMLEYEIIKWKSAGLPKESTVRLSKMLKIDEVDMMERIGKLQNIDIMRIKDLLG